MGTALCSCRSLEPCSEESTFVPTALAQAAPSAVLELGESPQMTKIKVPHAIMVAVAISGLVAASMALAAFGVGRSKGEHPTEPYVMIS